MRRVAFHGAAVIAIGVAVIPVTANASPQPSARVSSSASVLRGSRAQTIECALKTSTAHVSGHVPKNVNVVATVQCSAPVSGIKIKVQLLRNGHAYKTSGWVSNNGRAFIKGSAARRCVKRYHYQGQAWAFVWAPPGYQPPLVKLHHWGPSRYLASCNYRS